MTSNYADLMININRNAPWLLGENKTFITENIQEDVRRVLSDISGSNLVIITGSGRLFQQHLALWLEDDKLMIDKPFEWDNEDTLFDVFFRRKGIWNFFRISGAEADQARIYAKRPKTICLLQKRLFQRTALPVGSKIVFRDQESLIDFAFLHDISEGGMLICEEGAMPRYPINSIIYDISIAFPAEELSDESPHRVLPYIPKGEIVRVHTDKSLSVSHYGVSFIHQEIALYRRFNSLVARLRDRAFGSNTDKNEFNFVSNRHQTGAAPISRTN